MSIINFDEQFKTLRPCEFILNGEKFAVEDVSPEIMDEIKRLGEDFEDDAISVDDFNSQTLSLLTGQPQEKFRGIPMRKANLVVSTIMDAVNDVQNRRARRSKKRR